MTDLILVTVMVAITALLALYARWCDRIATGGTTTPSPTTETVNP